MAEQLDSILEQCIALILERKARVQSCLLAYPAQADELDPLLRTAEQLSELPKPALPPEARARIEARLMKSASTKPRFVLAALLQPRPQPRLRWALGGLAAAIVLLLLIVALVQASTTALPDSPLYPLKRTSESAWLQLAPTRSEPALHLRFAHRRLDEVQAMVLAGSVDLSVIEALTDETDAALMSAESLPPELALPLLEEMVEFTAYQQEELASLLGSAPTASRVSLTQALRASGELATRASGLILVLRPAPQEPSEGVEAPGESGVSEPPGPFHSPLLPPGQENRPETPPGLIDSPADPPGQENRPEVPPGLEKDKDKETPPGQQDKETPPGQQDKETPPGQQDRETPPGQQDKETPPGQDKEKDESSSQGAPPGTSDGEKPAKPDKGSPNK
jgi:hypothetical protein